MSETYPYQSKQNWGEDWKSGNTKGSNYGVYSPTVPRHDDYIVVCGENTYMVCRSRNALLFEYDIIGYFPNRFEAVSVAKTLNEKEDTK